MVNKIDIQLVTIARFDNLVIANIIKSKLESENIECYLMDENTVSVNPLYTIAIGYIKIKVRKKDFNKAIKILDAPKKSDNKNINYNNNENKLAECPNCKTLNLREIKKIKKYPFISFFIDFPIKYPVYYWECRQCNYYGQQKEPVVIKMYRIVSSFLFILILSSVFSNLICNLGEYP